MKTDFKPGDIVEFCGEQAEVIENWGESGLVCLADGEMVKWKWDFEGTPVTLVNKVFIGKVRGDIDKEYKKALAALLEHFEAYRNGWLNGEGDNEWVDRIGLPEAIEQAEKLIGKR